jgi:hypothetical protein
MRLWFQCAECLALHSDVDAARKCKHEFRTEVDTLIVRRYDQDAIQFVEDVLKLQRRIK